LLLLNRTVSLNAGKGMTRELFKTKGGFTLVETVLAVMILSIALGACILSFSMAMRTVGTASNQMAALHYARDQLEVLRTNTFNGLTVGTFSIPTNANTYGNLYGSYTVSTVNTNTKDITMRVIYLNRIHRGVSTNILTTSMVSTLHP
jgi:prepilin-type N-terminal cleavage/methylation domain-containing protein